MKSNRSVELNRGQEETPIYVTSWFMNTRDTKEKWKNAGLFNKWCYINWRAIWGRKGIPYLISHTPTNINSTQTSKLKCGSKTVELLDNDTREYLDALRTGTYTGVALNSTCWWIIVIKKLWSLENSTG